VRVKGRLSLRRRRSDERGASAVEFALISLPLLLLLFGIIQYSIFFWGYQAGANGAREGARRYAVEPCADHAALITSRIGGASSGAVASSRSFSGAYPPQAGDSVTVTISFSPQEIAGGLVPMPGTITQTSTARVEDVEDC